MVERVDSSWKKSLSKALGSLEPEYLEFLKSSDSFFPKRENLFNAFSTLPKERVKYILFGQDPYPRLESATGYAFIDGKVKEIFSQKGLSKDVNRATSLRNFIKMALVAEGLLDCSDLSQDAISKIEKSNLIESIDQLRENFEQNGVLLLNTALIFTSKSDSKEHIKSWRGFIASILEEMREINPTLILFGNSAKGIKKHFNISSFEKIELEHPYNHSFICNPVAVETFGKMELLKRRKA